MLRPKSHPVTADPDMTPMIDMTFQLIAFFMVLLNFGEGEVDARVKLPSSQLAKPAETVFDYPLVVQLTSDDQVIFGGDTMSIPALSQPLKNEARYLKLNGKSAADATVIIRADAEAKGGVVQEVMQKCQENGFDNFALRAKQEESELNQ